METKQYQKIIAEINYRTVTVIALCIIISNFPELSELMVYDRKPLLTGQVWRLFTSHFVHFGNTHLLYNIVVFGLTGWMVEKRNQKQLLKLCSVSAILISLFLLMFRPEMAYYGGLSGLSCSVLFYMAISFCRESGIPKYMGVFIVVVTMLKIIIELLCGNSLLPYSGKVEFVLIPEVHVIGCGVAVVLSRVTFSGFSGLRFKSINTHHQ